MVSFRMVRKSARSFVVKDIIDSLVLKYGSLRKAADAIGVSHQNLSNWRRGGKKQEELFEFLKRAQKDLKLSDAATYKKAVKK